MSREIKFRAWDKQFKKMVFEILAQDDQNCLEILNDHVRYEYMQFTGLHDKNGKEIYEGDIVGWWGRGKGHPFKDGSKSKKGVAWAIGWDGTKGKWAMRYFNEKSTSGEVFNNCVFGFTADLAKKKEIIGNIYENPDLVK